MFFTIAISPASSSSWRISAYAEAIKSASSLGTLGQKVRACAMYERSSVGAIGSNDSPWKTLQVISPTRTYKEKPNRCSAFSMHMDDVVCKGHIWISTCGVQNEPHQIKAAQKRCGQINIFLRRSSKIVASIRGIRRSKNGCPRIQSCGYSCLQE